MKCLKFLKSFLFTILCLINIYLSFQIEFQGPSFGNSDPIIDLLEGLNHEIKTIDDIGKNKKNENNSEINNDYEIFKKETSNDLNNKDFNDSSFFPLRIEDFLKPVNPFKNLMKHKNDGPQVFESSGPGFHVIEIKNHFGGPINLNSNLERKQVEKEKRLGSIFDFQNSVSNTPSQLNFEDFNKDPFENIFSSKPKVHIQVFRIPKRKLLKIPGNAPAPGRFLNGFDQMLEGFFDGLAKGLLGNEIEHNIKHHKKHKDLENEVINKEFEDLNKVFDSFFGNDNKDSNKKHQRLKKSSHKNDKSSSSKRIKFKDPKKMDENIADIIINESKNLTNISNDKHLDYFGGKNKNLISSSNNNSNNIVTPSSALNSTLTLNNTNIISKDESYDKWWSKFTDIKSHKILSYSLKYITYIILIILIGIIAYTCLFIVFKSIYSQGGSEKALFSADEIEDELKSINKSRQSSNQKYY